MALVQFALPAILLALLLTWLFGRLRRAARDPAEDRAALEEAERRIAAIERDRAEPPAPRRD